MGATRIVYEGRKFCLEQREVADRAGNPRQYDLVVHPGSAVVLPILEDGRVVLISSYRFAVGKTLLELPAGTIDPPEAAEECARRELTEETGYRAGKLELLVSFYSTPGICTECMYVFLATELVAGESAPEAGERIENMLMEYEDALQAIKVGRIIDAKTIVGLLYYDRYVHARG